MVVSLDSHLRLPISGLLLIADPIFSAARSASTHTHSLIIISNQFFSMGISVAWTLCRN